MRRVIPILLTLLLLAACGKKEQLPAMEPKSGSSPASEPSAQAQTDKPQTDPSEELRNIAADFALNFPFAFSSPEELDPARFCFLKIYDEDPGAEDGEGIVWVSPERLKEEVERRFDISDYQFRSPEQENVYPRYVEEKGAIAFRPAGHGIWLSAELADLAAEGEYLYYTFEFYDDVISDEHPERTLEGRLRYQFRVAETDGGALYLRAVSAADLGPWQSP